jgi:hypothetical protein
MVDRGGSRTARAQDASVLSAGGPVASHPVDRGPRPFGAHFWDACFSEDPHEESRLRGAIQYRRILP